MTASEFDNMLPMLFAVEVCCCVLSAVITALFGPYNEARFNKLAIVGILSQPVLVFLCIYLTMPLMFSIFSGTAFGLIAGGLAAMQTGAQKCGSEAQK